MIMKTLFPKNDNIPYVISNANFVDLNSFLEKEKSVDLTIDSLKKTIIKGAETSFTFSTNGEISLVYNKDLVNVNISSNTITVHSLDYSGICYIYVVSRKDDFDDAHAVLELNIEDIMITTSTDYIELVGNHSTKTLTFSTNTGILEYTFNGNAECILTELSSTDASKTLSFTPSNDESLENANGNYNLHIIAKVNNEEVAFKDVVVSISNWKKGE